jgi:hypothetical protein
LEFYKQRKEQEIKENKPKKKQKNGALNARVWMAP